MPTGTAEVWTWVSPTPSPPVSPGTAGKGVRSQCGLGWGWEGRPSNTSKSGATTRDPCAWRSRRGTAGSPRSRGWLTTGGPTGPRPGPTGSTSVRPVSPYPPVPPRHVGRGSRRRPGDPVRRTGGSPSDRGGEGGRRASRRGPRRVSGGYRRGVTDVGASGPGATDRGPGVSDERGSDLGCVRGRKNDSWMTHDRTFVSLLTLVPRSGGPPVYTE